MKKSSAKMFSIETKNIKDIFNETLIEAISDLIFEYLRRVEYNENVLNIFSEEGIRKYVEFIVEKDEFRLRDEDIGIIWVNWNKLIKDYTLKTGDNINNTRFMVNVSICIEKMGKRNWGRN